MRKIITVPCVINEKLETPPQSSPKRGGGVGNNPSKPPLILRGGVRKVRGGRGELLGMWRRFKSFQRGRKEFLPFWFFLSFRPKGEIHVSSRVRDLSDFSSLMLLKMTA
jgi:hypothetical protein